jgi:hypothetical protein
MHRAERQGPSSNPEPTALFFKVEITPWWVLKCLILQALNLHLKVIKFSGPLWNPERCCHLGYQDRSWGTFHCVGIRDPNNLCGVEFTESAMTTPGIRSTESVNATRVLAFGPRNPWTQRHFWRSVHGIRGRNDTSGVRYTESVDATTLLAFGPRNPCT